MIQQNCKLTKAVLSLSILNRLWLSPNASFLFSLQVGYEDFVAPGAADL